MTAKLIDSYHLRRIARLGLYPNPRAVRCEPIFSPPCITWTGSSSLSRIGTIPFDYTFHSPITLSSRLVPSCHAVSNFFLSENPGVWVSTRPVLTRQVPYSLSRALSGVPRPLLAIPNLPTPNILEDHSPHRCRPPLTRRRRSSAQCGN